MKKIIATKKTPPKILGYNDKITVGNLTYTVQSRLGAGTFGNVYRCIPQNPTDQAGIIDQVAIKVSQDDPLHLSVARKEGTLLSQLKHPHIIHYIDKDPTGRFLVLELCSQTLNTKIKQSYPGLDPAIAQRVYQHLLSALVYLTKKNIVHRDIKPENILEKQIPKSPTLESLWKLADFGTAAKNPGKATCRVSTLTFSAPETLIHIDNAYTHSYPSDLFSLGVVMYETVTGKPLLNRLEDHLTDSKNSELLRITLTGTQPGSPLKHYILIKSPLKPYIEQALAIDPAQRPSAASLLEEVSKTGRSLQG